MDVEKLCEEIVRNMDGARGVYTIPVPENYPCLVLEFDVWNVQSLLGIDGIDIFYHIDYPSGQIHFWWEDCSMKYKYVADIPYENRSSYVEFMKEANDLAGVNGTCSLLVNNIPY